ncbi:MAG: hypothetical protein KGL72_00610 [Actinomycetales bacterium]|nr:hypothetical protein [Actinomycetales bacterium]
MLTTAKKTAARKANRVIANTVPDPDSLSNLVTRPQCACLLPSGTERKTCHSEFSAGTDADQTVPVANGDGYAKRLGQLLQLAIVTTHFGGSRQQPNFLG